MKSLAAILVVVTTSLTAGAQQSDLRFSYEYRSLLLDRAYSVRPRRRDTPARAENISDEEVREAQAAAKGAMPGDIVNIGVVVTGCSCEDGPKCTDQVWIQGFSPRRSDGLLLSKIDGHWTRGPVQQWWLGYQQIQADEWKFKTRAEFWLAENRHIETFPACPEELGKSAIWRRRPVLPRVPVAPAPKR